MDMIIRTVVITRRIFHADIRTNPGIAFTDS